MRRPFFQQLAIGRRSLAALFCLLIFSLSACGSDSGASRTTDPTVEPTPAPTHKVPTWLATGSWRLYNIPDMGVYLGDRETSFVASSTGLSYSYPDCSMTGTLTMDPDLISVAANSYTLVMETTDCSRQWDIPTYPGMVDTGRIFAVDATNQWFYRISDLYAAYWVYQKK